MVAILISLIFVTPHIANLLADTLYPPQTKSFGSQLSSLFSSKKKQTSKRDLRAQQFQVGFCIFGASGLIILFILDLPRLRRLEERQPQAPVTDKNNDNDLAKTYVGESPIADGPRFVGDKQRYRIDKSLASGGAGIVYCALDTTLNRQVALKELFDDVAQDPEQAARFKIEAQALAAFNHPNIVPVYDMFEECGHFWLVMELLTGGDLSTRIKKEGIIDTQSSLKLIRGIASGLHYAHLEGFVHRDIKPENILFAADGGFRLTDFGIAKTQESNIKTQQGIILGSPGYMSPEQASGEALDLRSDIYSLGITLYQMVTGKIPFEGETSQVLIKHITQPPESPRLRNPEITHDVDNLIMKMLEKSADKRFKDCQELIMAIDKILANITP